MTDDEEQKYIQGRDTSTQFHAKTLVEERSEAKGRTINVRFNEEEIKELESFLDMLDTDNEGRVIKILLKAGANVLQSSLGERNLRWMARRGRARVLGVQE